MSVWDWVKCYLGIGNGELPDSEYDDTRRSVDDDDDYVVLKTENGEDVRFFVVAGINYNSKYYYILQPDELLEGMADNEALVFEYTRNGDDENYSIVTDDAIVDAVFLEYNRILDEEEGITDESAVLDTEDGTVEYK